MVNETDVRFILETYELAPETQERLVRIATARLEELFINTFDSQYSFIARLVDKFQTPYSQRLEESLDRSRYWNDSRNLYEIRNFHGSDRENEIREEEEQQVEPLAPQTLEFLREELPTAQYEFVLQLSQRVNRPYRISTYAIKRNIDSIKTRLDELAERYQENGAIHMPRRPIESVEFDPLSIVFRPRCYQGNPIYFFEDNDDIYRGMSRTEMSRFDSGLYDALRRTNQLDFAIPAAVQ